MKTQMKITLALAVVLMTPIGRAFDLYKNKCERNPKQLEAAKSLKQRLQRSIDALPSPLKGFDSLEVTDVGSSRQEICGLHWEKRVLKQPTPDVAMMPSCGVAYIFSNEEGLVEFAKASAALEATLFRQVTVFPPGSENSFVSPNDGETFGIPVCAALKK